MKITILQQDLYPAIQAVSRSVGAKNLPVLANILLKTVENGLELSATNLEIGIIKKVHCKVEEQGSLTVPARTFLEVISPLTGADLELAGTNDQLTITAKNFNGSLNGISASEFPAIPLSTEQSVEVETKLISESVPQITFAAASDEGRPILTGILTEIKKSGIELVSTDGFRLAHKNISTKVSDSVSFKSLIPRRTFEEVVRVISEEQKGSADGKMTISTSENQNQMIFKVGETVISSRLIEGQFPSWEKIIPTKFVSEAVLDRAEFIKAVKLASVFARNEANVIKIETQEKQLKLTSEAKQLGAQESEVDAEITGEPVVIAFNSKYLLDALSACSSKQVKIEFSGNLSAALIKPQDEKDLEYVVMPIRLT
jgi:DNA polymerase-3 subunit beta